MSTGEGKAFMKKIEMEHCFVHHVSFIIRLTSGKALDFIEQEGNHSVLTACVQFNWKSP